MFTCTSLSYVHSMQVTQHGFCNKRISAPSNRPIFTWSIPTPSLRPIFTWRIQTPSLRSIIWQIQTPSLRSIIWRIQTSSPSLLFTTWGIQIPSPSLRSLLPGEYRHRHLSCALYYLGNTDTFSPLYITWQIQTSSLPSLIPREYRHLLSGLYYLVKTDTFSSVYNTW